MEGYGLGVVGGGGGWMMENVKDGDIMFVDYFVVVELMVG